MATAYESYSKPHEGVSKLKYNRRVTAAGGSWWRRFGCLGRSKRTLLLTVPSSRSVIHFFGIGTDGSVNVIVEK